MSLGDRIKEARNRKKLTQAQLSEYIGMSKNAVSNYENGVSFPQSIEVFTAIMNILEVDANYLLQDEMGHNKKEISIIEEDIIKKYRVLDEHGKKMVDIVLDEEHGRCVRNNELEEIKQRYRTIPYSISPASAGYGEWIDENSYDDIDIPNIPEYALADFAVRVHGDSMVPTYEDGDIVLVHTQDAVWDGDIGLFWVEDEGGLIKEYKKGSLYPHNKGYNPITLRGKNYRCFGKVIAKLER